jgi:hypothetical protein
LTRPRFARAAATGLRSAPAALGLIFFPDGGAVRPVGQ